MGSVIARNAAASRIADDVLKTVTRADARGGDIQTLTQARFSVLYPALTAIEQQYEQACAANDLLYVTLMARDNESDLTIGAISDEVYNTLGRVSASVDYKLIFGSGKKAWTDGDPVQQPLLMKVLAANIRQTNNAKLIDRKEDWAARIEQKAAAQAKAAEPLAAADAQVTTLKLQRRTLANAAQVALVRLKRDFKNIGMTEAQIHEIIPDSPAGSSAAPTKPVQQPTGNEPIHSE
jgi:hypothetical protein